MTAGMMLQYTRFPMMQPLCRHWISLSTTMVDDPYTFGQIAAANALSDIYAMGGEVKTALNIVCFPEKMVEYSG